MPWCPNCKTEYQEGIEICADCGAALVDELTEEVEMALVAFINDEKLAEKLVDYLNYSSIKADCQYVKKEDSYAVIVPKPQIDEAKVAFGAFYKVESKNQLMKDMAEEEAQNQNEDGIEFDPDLLESIPEDQMSSEEKEAMTKAAIANQVYKPAGVYVKKADESKDMFSTAVTFLAFGALLLIFVILNAFGIVTLFSSITSLTFLSALTVGCCLVGINAIKRSRKAEAASVEEERLTAALNEWLDTNVNDGLFDGLENEGLSDELLYFRRTELIRNKLVAEYPDLDDDYVDDLIEDYYNSHFDSDSASEEDSEDSQD